MRTAESELLRKENNTARRPEKLSRSTKFYALKVRRLEAFFDSKTQNSFDPNELKFVEIVEII